MRVAFLVDASSDIKGWILNWRLFFSPLFWYSRPNGYFIGYVMWNIFKWTVASFFKKYMNTWLNMFQGPGKTTKKKNIKQNVRHSPWITLHNYYINNFMNINKITKICMFSWEKVYSRNYLNISTFLGNIRLSHIKGVYRWYTILNMLSYTIYG